MRWKDLSGILFMFMCIVFGILAIVVLTKDDLLLKPTPEKEHFCGWKIISLNESMKDLPDVKDGKIRYGIPYYVKDASGGIYIIGHITVDKYDNGLIQINDPIIKLREGDR